MVTVRPTRAEDDAALALFFEGLSADTAQRRFNAPLPRLSTTLLRRLLGEVPGVRAWVALAPDGATIVGHAMMAETSDPAHVEFGVVVADAWQHTGVGHLLAVRAREAVLALAPDDPVVELAVHPGNRPAMGWAVRAVNSARRCLDARGPRLELVALL
jgi:hypothetical protein